MKKFFFGLLVLFILASCATTAPAPAPVADIEAPPPPPPAETPKGGIILDGASSYTVVRGDTLSDIAAVKYNESNRYYFPLIHIANTEVADPDVLEVGTRLTIPDLQKNLNSAGAKAEIRTGMLKTAEQYERQSKPRAAAKLKDLASKLAK